MDGDESLCDGREGSHGGFPEDRFRWLLDPSADSGLAVTPVAHRISSCDAKPAQAVRSSSRCAWEARVSQRIARTGFCGGSEVQSRAGSADVVDMTDLNESEPAASRTVVHCPGVAELLIAALEASSGTACGGAAMEMVAELGSKPLRFAPVARTEGSPWERQVPLELFE